MILASVKWTPKKCGFSDKSGFRMFNFQSFSVPDEMWFSGMQGGHEIVQLILVE